LHRGWVKKHPVVNAYQKQQGEVLAKDMTRRNVTQKKHNTRADINALIRAAADLARA
jgi:hypothetical protein